MLNRNIKKQKNCFYPKMGGNVESTQDLFVLFIYLYIYIIIFLKTFLLNKFSPPVSNNKSNILR